MNINRDIYLQRLIDSRHNRMIKVITGVRRCGKSYLLFHLFTEWLIAEGVGDDHIITVNLEDRRNKIGFVSPERRYEAPTVARPPQM